MADDSSFNGRTKEVLDSEWYFTGSTPEPCDGCGDTSDRLGKVRRVFSVPLCIRCFHDRRRSAPKGEVLG